MALTRKPSHVEVRPMPWVDVRHQRQHAVARQGNFLERPPKSTADQRAEIIAKYDQVASVSALARAYGVSRANILAVVKPRGDGMPGAGPVGCLRLGRLPPL